MLFFQIVFNLDMHCEFVSGLSEFSHILLSSLAGLGLCLEPLELTNVREATSCFDKQHVFRHSVPILNPT
jgi:hypothetical protein